MARDTRVLLPIALSHFGSVRPRATTRAFVHIVAGGVVALRVRTTVRFEQFGRLPNSRTTKNTSRELAATWWSAPSRRRPQRRGTDALELEHRDKPGESAQQSGSAGCVLFLDARFVRGGSAEKSSKALAPEPKEPTDAAPVAEELLAGVRTS